MPGIAGIIAKTHHRVSPTLVAEMVETMRHEEFYQCGTWSCETLNLTIGWANLTGAFADCMPLWNETQDICLVFSGEDFADQSVIDSLRKKHHGIEEGTASYLVHWYEEVGDDFFKLLNGWFCGLLIDLRKKKAILFNDRYGAQRLFYHENEEGLFFASEAKALLRVLPKLRALDLKGLGEFLCCGSVLQNRSMFPEISMLTGGSAWVSLPGGQLEKQVYFRKEEWESLPQLEADAYYEELKSKWARLVPKYFRGRQKVGMSLTGGVDSRMVLAWAPSAKGELPCYTWAGSYRDCKDVTLSRQIASICGQPHQCIPVGDDFLREFPSLAARSVYMCDGGMDVTGSIDLFVQRAARQIAPVRLGGVYGGEVLRHLVMFKPVALEQEFLGSEAKQSMRDCFATYREEIAGHRLSFTAFKQAPWYITSKFAIEGSQLTHRSPYFDNDLVALAYQSPTEMTASNDASLRMIVDGNPELRRVETDRSLSSNAIPGVTRLMHAYQEFTFKAEYAYDYGMPQWLAKTDHFFKWCHFENLFLGRHKFHHFRVWYRDKLAPYVKEVLLDGKSRNRSYIRGDAIEKMVAGHTKGSENHTMAIHKLLTIELIQRQLIEGWN